MPKTDRHFPEVRERTVRMVAEHRDEYPSDRAAVTSIAGKLGMTPETLRIWVCRTQINEGLRPGLPSRQ
jgi:transposase-like protein